MTCPSPSSYRYGPLGSLIVAALLLVGPSDYSRGRVYRCTETDDPAEGCICTPSSSSSAARCERKYDCCREVSYGSLLTDDPTRGYSCQCWLLRPGQTCESDLGPPRRAGASSAVARQASTCPP